MPDDLVTAPVRDSRLRSNWVRLRTLILLRWIAIAGQAMAIAVATQVFDLRLDVGLCSLVIGAAAVTNLVAHIVYPRNTRLTERGVAGFLTFDIAQLSALLALSGGLHNPFALLILAPVTISATALKPRTTVLLGGVAVLMMSAAALWYVPLTTSDGNQVVMAPIFVFGFWAAIVIGIVFMGVFAQRVSAETHAMSDALAATQMALAREQKLTDIGGIVAATAHELGTPLATIKLASSELIDDLADLPGIQEDARLILEQAERCSGILRSMGRIGKDDLHTQAAPLSAILQEAAEPHENRGRNILYDLAASDTETSGQPVVFRRPEIIHALRNLIQNAVDFAATSVWIEATWTNRIVRVKISDDGPGYPVGLLNRIGDPFLSGRDDAHAAGERAGYEGMGLGLFIAKALLERTGAKLTFANRSGGEAGKGGAVVECVWQRASIAVPAGWERRALGDNLPFS